MKNIIKAFKDYIKLTKQEVQIAAGNHAYFANFYMDLPLFKDLLKDYNREFTIITRDNTRIEIKNPPNLVNKHTEINWNAD